MFARVITAEAGNPCGRRYARHHDHGNAPVPDLTKEHVPTTGRSPLLVFARSTTRHRRRSAPVRPECAGSPAGRALGV